MEQSIHISSVNGSPVICFDTGMDPRSFARTKMSQSLIEQGFVVSPDGSHEIWKPSGVNETDGNMRVFGPVFQGKRLDLLLNDVDSPSHESTQTALQAITFWIRAKMFLGDRRSALNPGASFVGSDGGVFFAPEHLANRCLYIEGFPVDRYNCPDLIGMDNAAFCAAVMLYKVFTGVHPYPTAEIFQDMREGIFMPMRLAAPDLDENLSNLIFSALTLPVVKKNVPAAAEKNGAAILTGILKHLITNEKKIAAVSSLYTELPPEKKEKIEKERKLHVLKQKSIIKTRRFAVRHKQLLIVLALAVSFSLFIVYHTAISIAQRPTTAGMSPETVVYTYYDSFSTLNHIMMSACVQRAGRADINAAANFYAVIRTRQAYDPTTPPLIQAKAWQENGRELPAPNVFGITDLKIDHLGGTEEGNMVVFRASYLLWAPDESFARNRNDDLTLRRDRRGNWRIIELVRRER